MTIEFTVLIAVVGTVIGAILGISGRWAESKRRAEDQAKGQAKLEMMVETVNVGVTSVQTDVRDISRQQNEFNTRLTAVEESSKSAHHRINRTDERINKIERECEK